MDIVEAEKRLWIPPEVELESPVDGTEDPADRNVHVNTVPGEIEPATEEEMREEVRRFGKLREPEIGREEKPPPPGAAAFGSYIDDYPTRFFFRSDVARLIPRIQKKFPWASYICTYLNHPPVYGPKYQHVSLDVWGGGLVNGRYAGYRGKTLGYDLGWKIFNALFNDPYLPSIYWVIWAGKMWTRGYGWGPAPWGPAGSDAGHHYHIHCSYIL